MHVEVMAAVLVEQYFGGVGQIPRACVHESVQTIMVLLVLEVIRIKSGAMCFPVVQLVLEYAGSLLGESESAGTANEVNSCLSF